MHKRGKPIPVDAQKRKSRDYHDASCQRNLFLLGFAAAAIPCRSTFDDHGRKYGKIKSAGVIQITGRRPNYDL